MGGIFISYRRDDSTGYVHALRDRLAARFGASQIFMDIDSIEPGLDFMKVIESSVASCEVVLVVIGKRWLQPQRLQNASDFVRLEIQTALARDIPVIPLLLEGTEMPKAEDLPGVLAPLSRCQAFEITNSRFTDDLNQFSNLLGKRLNPHGTRRITALASSAFAWLSRGFRRVTISISWLMACGQVLLTFLGLFSVLDDPSPIRRGAVLGCSFFCATALALAAALILRALAKSLAWKFFTAGVALQVGCLVIALILDPSSRSDASTAFTVSVIFLLPAAGYLWLAYQCRKEPKYKRRVTPRRNDAQLGPVFR